MKNLNYKSLLKNKGASEGIVQIFFKKLRFTVFIIAFI